MKIDMKRVLLPGVLSLALLSACGGQQQAAANPSAPAEAPAVAASASVTPEPTPAETSVHPAALYPGRWVDLTSQRATMMILPAYDVPEYSEPAYDVTVRWGGSASEASVWTMRAVYDPETDSLTYTGGKMAEVSYSADGAADEVVQWTDAEGSLRRDENGHLRWTDSREKRSGDFDLERGVTPAPTAEQFRSGFFDPVCSYAAGTAGVSMREALAARDVLQFANRSELWNVDAQAARQTQLDAWNTMDDSAKALFTDNFDALSRRIDGAFADFEAAKGAFEDAGAAEDMARLTALPEVRAAWELLKGNTLSTEGRGN